jgi:hypothetical protein
MGCRFAFLHCPTATSVRSSRPASSHSGPAVATRSTDHKSKSSPGAAASTRATAQSRCRQRADLRCGADPRHQQARDPRARGGRADPRRTGPPRLLLVPRRPDHAGRPGPSRPSQPRHQPTRRRQRAAVGTPSTSRPPPKAVASAGSSCRRSSTARRKPASGPSNPASSPRTKPVLQSTRRLGSEPSEPGSA